MPFIFSALPQSGFYLPKFFQEFLLRVARAAHGFRHINDDVSFRENKFKTDMQRLLYNTARNLVERERRASKKAKASAGGKKKPATVTGSGDNNDNDTVVLEGDTEGEQTSAAQMSRSTGCFSKATTAYERARVLMDGGITLEEFTDDLQRSVNVWMQSRSLRKTKAKVEELLVLLEGTQASGPWQEIVEKWKPYLQRLPGNE